ncbi:MAG: 30S ribosomal protein S17e [Candidatus Diapherotrites archaeon]|nr:30S ribosomal protein S17e [Candidatus Diapherotrites archaeon]
MGKAVPKSIKMRAEVLLLRFPDKFSGDFEKNKEIVNQLDLPFSKFDRNMVAGFITRTMNKKKEAAAKPVVQEAQEAAPQVAGEAPHLSEGG